MCQAVLIVLTSSLSPTKPSRTLPEDTTKSYAKFVCKESCYPCVNFINVFRAHFSYGRHVHVVHVTRKKAAETTFVRKKKRGKNVDEIDTSSTSVRSL